MAHRKYMSRVMMGRLLTKETRARIKRHHWSRDPIKRKRISEAQSKLICELIKSGKLNGKNKAFKTGYYLNTTTGKKEFYRSSYERNRMERLNDNPDVRAWTTKHNIRIPYDVAGTTHYYLPDFMVVLKTGERIIEEVKGYIENEALLQRKIKAARSYCKQRNIRYRMIYDNCSKN